MRPLVLALVVFVLGCRESGVSTDPPLARAEDFTWVQVPPFKDFSHGIQPVVDIERRLPLKHDYYHEDPVTWVHEGTHYINSNVTREKGKQGLYLMDGRAVILIAPNLTLEQIAVAIPEKDRRTIYQTYLIDQRQWWNKEPLYLLNEWVAYGNGCACRKSLNKTGKDRIDTVRFALEMEVYVRHMASLARKDPAYKDIETLDAFIDWHGNRIRYLAGPEDTELAASMLDNKTVPVGKVERMVPKK